LLGTTANAFSCKVDNTLGDSNVAINHPKLNIYFYMGLFTHVNETRVRSRSNAPKRTCLILSVRSRSSAKIKQYFSNAFLFLISHGLFGRRDRPAFIHVHYFIHNMCLQPVIVYSNRRTNYYKNLKNVWHRRIYCWGVEWRGNMEYK